MNEQVQHQEHREWLSQLDFYQDEIRIFQQELGKVIREHPDFFRLVEHVEEYRSILMRKLERVDDLRYRISLHERQLADGLAEVSDAHEQTRVEMERFVHDFEAMKTNFRRFVSRNN